MRCVICKRITIASKGGSAASRPHSPPHPHIAPSEALSRLQRHPQQPPQTANCFIGSPQATCCRQSQTSRGGSQADRAAPTHPKFCLACAVRAVPAHPPFKSYPLSRLLSASNPPNRSNTAQNRHKPGRLWDSPTLPQQRDTPRHHPRV